MNKDYGFYFLNLWKHNSEYGARMFVLIDVEFHGYEQNWTIMIRLFNFDFGYISKPRSK